MTTEGTWKIIPLRSCILAILEKRGDVALESDITQALKDLYGDYSESELNKALMSLENQGLIHVSWINKSKRRIQKMTKEMDFLAIGED